MTARAHEISNDFLSEQNLIRTSLIAENRNLNMDILMYIDLNIKML